MENVLRSELFSFVTDQVGRKSKLVDPVEKSPCRNGVFIITTAIIIVFIIIIIIDIIITIIIIIINIIIIIIFIVIVLTFLFCLY